MRPRYAPTLRDFRNLPGSSIAVTKAGGIQIITPLIALHKAEIVTLGLELGAPFDLTWSCYRGEDRACGECDSCVLRLRAFRQAGVVDPIPYEAPAKTAVEPGDLGCSIATIEDPKF